MARTDNLDNFLTDVASAIRGKTSKQANINPEDFDTEIESIETGITPTGTKQISTNGTHDVTTYASAEVNVPQPSGSISITENGSHDVSNYATANVNVSGETKTYHAEFYDIDGNVIYTYTKAQLQQMGALPVVPTVSGFKDGVWNWLYENVLSELGTQDLVIGCNYNTDDGYNHMWVTLPEGYLSPIITFNTTYTGTPTSSNSGIDWGDGSSEEVFPKAVSNKITLTHTYSEPGTYCIKFKVLLGNILVSNTVNLNANSTGNASSLFWDGNTVGSVTYQKFVHEIDFCNTNSNITVNEGWCYGMYNLKRVVLPGYNTSKKIINVWGNDLNQFKGICCKYMCVPANNRPTLTTTSFGRFLFSDSKYLEVVSLPDLVMNADRTFQNCNSLRKTNYPLRNSSGSSSVAYPGFYYNLHGKPLKITDKLSGYCRGQTCVVSVDISELSISSIPDYMFYSCSNLRTVKYGTGITQIGKNAFSSTYVNDIPNTVDTIGERSFYDSSDVRRFVVPPSVNNIGSQALYRSNCCVFDFSQHTTVPTIVSNSITGNTQDYIYMYSCEYRTPYHILVKYSKFNDFLSDSVWSTLSTRLTGVASRSELINAGHSTLPSDDGNGNSIIWYCDERCTVRVYKVDDYNDKYYCTLAS